jgi:hypothetical protein
VTLTDKLYIFGLFPDPEGNWHAMPVEKAPQLPPAVTWETPAYVKCVEADAREHMTRLGLSGKLVVWERFLTVDLTAEIKVNLGGKR